MKKSLFILTGLIGVSFAPLMDSSQEVSRIEVRKISGEPEDMEGKKILINGKKSAYSSYLINQLENGKSCFCFEEKTDYQGLSITMRVDKIARNGPNFHRIKLHDQVGGELCRFLNSIIFFVPGPGMEESIWIKFSCQTPEMTCSKETFDYVAQLTKSLIADIDPNTKVTEQVTAEEQGKIRYRYDLEAQELRLTFDFFHNPT